MLQECKKILKFGPQLRMNHCSKPSSAGHIQSVIRHELRDLALLAGRGGGAVGGSEPQADGGEAEHEAEQPASKADADDGEHREAPRPQRRQRVPVQALVPANELALNLAVPTAAAMSPPVRLARSTGMGPERRLSETSNVERRTRKPSSLVMGRRAGWRGDL